MTSPDYIVDIEGVATPGSPTPNKGATRLQGRPWLAVRWQCCSTYSRIYRNRAGSAYEGRCPRCQKSVRVGIGPEGSSNRFFEAS